jgi:hypothetical protein
MTIHFAAARPAVSTILGRRLASVPVGRAANDNCTDFDNDEVLRGALMQFAQHGLGAAAQARDCAEKAFLAGNRDNYRQWLGVCRALDRRMANGLIARIGAASI